MHVRLFVNIPGATPPQREVTVANADSVEDAAALVGMEYPHGIITGWAIVPEVNAELDSGDEAVSASE